MRSLRSTLYAASVLLMASASCAYAQGCYTPVAAWHGTYKLDANGTATCNLGTGNGTCTISQAVVANPNLNQPVSAVWKRSDVDRGLRRQHRPVVLDAHHQTVRGHVPLQS